MASWTMAFEDPGLALDVAGGKGASLGRLTRAGFPVPPGFVVTTAAYQAAVAEHGLDRVVADATAALDAAARDSAAAEAASATIRAAFRATTVAAEIAEAIDTAYERLGGGPVAVRSSATAEDLPELSFAGQQDTYLNVVGTDALLRAVLDCWSSLWTARALVYRRRAGIADDTVALAVVVQRMVPADVAGVLFTANPLTGHRGQMSIDATFGLGEALVSGQVEPDNVVADAASGRVLTRTAGSKAVATRALATGGVATDLRVADERPTLTDEQVAELVDVGARIAREYACPQDIEWALHDGALWVVQARPITSLYPLPDGAPAESLWVSFGAIQGMLAPITPLGRDALRCILAGAAEFVGNRVEPTTNPYLRDAGERIWIRVDRALRDGIGGRVLPVALRFMDPSAGAILASLGAELGLEHGSRRSARHTALSVGHFARRVLPRAAYALARPPQRARDRLDETVTSLVRAAARREQAASSVTDPVARAAERSRALRASLGSAFPTLAPRAGPVILPALLSLRLITRLVRGAGEGSHGVSTLVMEMTRSIPRNVTTEMDLALWSVAAAVRADAESRQRFTEAPTEQLAQEYAVGLLPHAAQEALAGFLSRYGMRGVGEIDLGRPRWREQPADVIVTVQRYLELHENLAPPVVFARGEQAAAQAVAQLAELAAELPGGRLRAAAVRFAASRTRAFAGARETPKFTMVQILGVARDGLLASGHDLVSAGLLEAPEDVFLLTLDELTGLSGSIPTALLERVARRRDARASELRRQAVPRVLVGDGRAFHEGLGAPNDPSAISGSPVSPGVVEGPVRVVHDPARADLRPGEVLVCPGTDPAWTPLFLTAGGLVTEVGGMMTHGSVVAREYGIPAVVGVHEATTRLRTGQRIRLDGSAGTITVLAEVSATSGQ